LLIVLLARQASEWPKPSTVSSDRCDHRRRDLECSLGNVAYVRAPDLRLPHHRSGAFFGLKETIRNVDGIKSDLAPDPGLVCSIGGFLFEWPRPLSCSNRPAPLCHSWRIRRRVPHDRMEAPRDCLGVLRRLAVGDGVFLPRPVDDAMNATVLLTPRLSLREAPSPPQCTRPMGRPPL
jgi:hypothetical protein